MEIEFHPDSMRYANNSSNMFLLQYLYFIYHINILKQAHSAMFLLPTPYSTGLQLHKHLPKIATTSSSCITSKDPVTIKHNESIDSPV